MYTVYINGQRDLFPSCMTKWSIILQYPNDRDVHERLGIALLRTKMAAKGETLDELMDYLALSTELKTVSCRLQSWLTFWNKLKIIIFVS